MLKKIKHRSSRLLSIRSIQVITAACLVIAAIATIAIIGVRKDDTTKAATLVKVMPLGDSITDGYGFDGAYRRYLWQTLVTQQGYMFDFVGSLSNGTADLGDKNHEGHSGWRIHDVRAQIDRWMSTYQPQIILLLLGSNDTATNYDVANAPARLQELIQRICVLRPGIVVVASTLTPEVGDPVDIPNFNAKMPAVVSALNANGCNVKLVDGFSALTYADLADGSHPNWAGHQKLANVFLPQLKTFLDGNTTPPTPPTPLPLGTHNDTAMTYSGTWQTSTGAEKYQSDDHYSSTTGATATVQFSGTQLKLTTSAASHHGIIGVKIDTGAETMVDLYSATRVDQKLVYTSPVLASGTHTVTIRITGTKNTASTGTVGVVDKLEVLNTTTTPPPPPPPPPPPTGSGDVNGDSRVNALDLSTLISRDGTNYPAADFNQDGTVGAADVAILLSKWTW